MKRPAEVASGESPSTMRVSPVASKGTALDAPQPSLPAEVASPRPTWQADWQRSCQTRALRTQCPPGLHFLPVEGALSPLGCESPALSLFTPLSQGKDFGQQVTRSSTAIRLAEPEVRVTYPCQGQLGVSPQLEVVLLKEPVHPIL